VCYDIDYYQIIVAVYELLYDEAGETHAYPVFFIRDELGNWKIWDL